jgi:tungstate transport system permease protein
VFITFSRAGPLGDLQFLFTKKAMVVGQIVLLSPIVTGLTISALSGVGQEVRDTAISLGASRFWTILTMLREAKYTIATAFLVSFGRAISEVGCALMVGGNIRGRTRVLTTTMSLETSMGNIELSMALGIIIMIIALGVSIIVNRLQQR